MAELNKNHLLESFTLYLNKVFLRFSKKAIAELLLNEQKFRYCFFNVQLLAIYCLSYTDKIKLFLFNN